MKKLFVPVIIAAVLGVAGAVAAILRRRRPANW